MKNFKKIIALVLALVMTMAIPMTAFAAPGSGTPIGSQEEQDLFVSERYAMYAEQEEPFWDYGEDHLYTDENGTTWIYLPGEKKNWIISAENPDWAYRVLDDGTLYVAYNATEGDENVIVPSTLDGKTVTKVRGAGLENALSITIPETVTEIGYKALSGKPNLKRVIIGSNLTAINVGAFSTASVEDKIEIYFCGTEKQWNDVVVWHQADWGDPVNWAVTGFDWTTDLYDDSVSANSTYISTVHYNVNPDTLEPLVSEEEEEEPTLWEKFIAGISGIIATITGFFKGLFGWIN